MEKKIVGFKLNEDDFAFDIMRVIEIIRLKEITMVPTAPSFIEGVINLRGKIIPIIDLRKRFNMESVNRDKMFRIIIVEYMKSQLVGVIVDDVTNVTNIKNGESLPAPATLTAAGAKYIESIVKTKDRIIVLLDIEKIFSEQEQEELNEITTASPGG